MMEEVFLHVGGSSVAISAMVQTLAEFASADGRDIFYDLKL
jgi:hypothetical protein